MKKKISLIICFLMICILSGCTPEEIKFNPYSFNLNFRYFLLPDTKSVHSIKIASIDLNEDNMTFSELNQISNIIYDMYNTCANKTFYLNNFENKSIFYENIKQYCNSDKFETIKKDNSFKESIDLIYEKQDTIWYDTKITSLNYQNKEKFFEVEVIAIDNTELFQIEKLNFYIDNENKITKIEIVENFYPSEYTTKSVDKNSLLNENGIHTDFINSFNELKSKLSNGILYEKYHLVTSSDILMTDEKNKLTQEEIESKEYKDQIDLQVNNLIESSKLDLNSEVLKQFFISGEGSYANTFITGYFINDYNAQAKSLYIIQSVSNGTLKTFEITFDRVENKIIDIKIL